MTRLNWVFASALAALVAAGASCSDNPSEGPESDGGEAGNAGGATGEGGSGGTGASASGGEPSIEDGGEGGDGGLGGADNCGTEQLTAEPKPVNVLLVVDKSLSMASTPDGFGQQKWAALGDAIQAALTATGDRVAFGLDFFPYSGSPDEPLATACSMPEDADLVVPIGEGDDTTDAINSAMAAHDPAGATPTAAALARALAYFRSDAGMLLEGDRYVLLATDGGPNCNEDLTCNGMSCTVNMDGLCPTQVENCCDPLLDPEEGASKCLDQSDTVAEIERLAAGGVKTFVLGIPGTDAYEATLNAMAVAGEVENPDPPPSYYAVSAADGVEALSEALLEITSGVIRTCELLLEMEPPDPDKINVVLDGETIPQDDDTWEFIADPPTILLKGDTCAAVQEQGVEHIEIVYGCRTVRVK